MAAKGFATAEQAREAANRWSFVLRRAFARDLVAVDFGEDDGPKNGSLPRTPPLADAYMRISGENKVHVEPANNGLYVHPADVTVTFSGGGVGKLEAGTPLARLVAGAREADATPDEGVATAYQLFTASESTASTPISRLVLLVAALEALSPREDRVGAWPELLDHLTRAVGASELEAVDQQRARSALDALRQVSITQSIVQRVEGMTLPAYVKRSPEELVKTAYSMRSDIMHGEAAPARGGQDDRLSAIRSCGPVDLREPKGV